MQAVNNHMPVKKIHVFTDSDLDGAASLLTFRWLLNPRYSTHTITRVTDFKKDFTRFTAKQPLSKFEKVFILDLDVSQDCLDLVDKKNVVIVDHHDTHVQNKHKYKNATVIVEQCTSCTKLIYQKFKQNSELTDEQRYLVLLADDYDSYALKLEDSYNLNVVLWNYQGDRFGKFEKDFGRGFFGFNKFQKNIITFHERKLRDLKESIEVFETTIPIKSTPTKFVSTFADSCINEIAEHIIDKYESDVGIVVNLKSRKVSLRKSKDCTVHLGDFSKKLLGGGGHEYAAGGVLEEDNERFANFTKLFKPIYEPSK